MTGHDYERVVAAYLRNKGYHNVKVTKGSGDFGVDVIAHKGKKKYAVQCKYYASPISVGAVQEAVAGKAMYGCNAAMVVTNSTFTKAAEELARCNDVVLIPGVNSKGITAKGVIKFIGISVLAIFAFILLAALSSAIDGIKAQFETGLYGQAVLNIIEWVAVLAVLIGLPISIKILLKRLKNKKADGNRGEEIPQEQQKTQPDQEPVSEINIPDGFNKYLNLNKSTAVKTEKTYTPTKKSREEMIQALLKLRADDFETYSHLYENVKPFLSDKRISVSGLQRKMFIGFAKADHITTALENIGFIVPRAENAEMVGKFLITEQEIVDLLAEVENINTPI